MALFSVHAGLREKPGYSENISILGRMVYQVKLEIISTVMNFLCIVQVKLSFMFARGVTSNPCSVERKGRKVLPD